MRAGALAGAGLLLILAGCRQFAAPPEPINTRTASPAPTPSVILSPEASPAETPSPIHDPTWTPSLCIDQRGEVEPYSFNWNGEELTGRIYTPPCYGADLGQVYPVLYLLHSATEDDSQWDDLEIDRRANKLINQGEIPPLLIVMPREITWIPLRDNQFGDLLIKAVLPWVDANYQTSNHRLNRAIGGLSRGGNWAVRLGLLHWGLFGSIGAHSTPLFTGDLNRLPVWLEGIPSGSTPRLLLDIGEDDNHLPEAEEFHLLLTGYEIEHEWVLGPGLHDDAYWRAHLEDYLLWYSTGWEDRGDNP